MSQKREHTYLQQLPSGEERPLSVEFTVTSWGSPGSPPSLEYPGDPPEPPEIEIGTVADEAGAVVTLTSEEEEAVLQAIIEDLDYDYDEPDYD